MVSLKTDTAPAVQWRHHNIIFENAKTTHYTETLFMKSWKVSIVLNLQTILYSYENNEIVKKYKLHKFFSEYIEKTKRF